MKNRILWIEDDSFTIHGLLRPIMKSGFIVDEAKSAIEGYKKALECQQFDLIIVDMILPLSIEDEQVPEKLKDWKKEKFVGVGLIKWLKLELKVSCPILILSIINEPIPLLNFDSNVGNIFYTSKRGLLPLDLKEKICEILK